MSKGKKKSGSQRRKEKAAKLGITRSQVEKLEGHSMAQRRKRDAEILGTSAASIRRETEFRWTKDTKLNKIHKNVKFPVTDQFLKAVGGVRKWNTQLFGRLNSQYYDSRLDHKTELGNELSKVNFLDSKWSQLSRSHSLVGRFETEFAGKMRSRSVYIASDYFDILKNWNDVKSIKECDLITKAFMMLDVQLPYVDKWTWDDLPNDIQSKDKDTSAGYPWMGHKVATISEAERKYLGIISLEDKYRDQSELLEKYVSERNELLSENETVVKKTTQRIELINRGEVPKVVNIAGLRTEAGAIVFGKSPYKQRLVWNVPYDHLLVEGLYCGQLLNAITTGGSDFGNHYWASLENKSREVPLGTLRIMDMIGRAKDEQVDCISIDYTAFDQHITSVIMKEVVKLIKRHSLLTENEGAYLEYGLLNSELWSGWGVLQRNNGVPSGSYITNLVDSLINAAFNEAIGIAFNTDIDYVVNGDDCCLITSENIQTSEIVKLAAVFGLEMNTEKQWRKRDAFNFNKEVWSEELNGHVPMLHRTLNTLMRHDQRKRVLHELEEVSAVFAELRRVENHPYRFEFLDWLLENTSPVEKELVHKLNPLSYLDVQLPPAKRYNLPAIDKEWRSVTTYDEDWFYKRCSEV